MIPLEERIASLEARVASLEAVRVIRIPSWDQRIIPGPGTRIGRDRVTRGWQLYREVGADLYDQTAVYIGYGLAVT